MDTWKDKCCINGLGKYLTDNKIATVEQLKSIQEKTDTAVQESIDFAVSSPDPDVSELMNNLFA